MVKLTFPRELRLLTPASFGYVFQEPLRASSKYITVLARDNQFAYPRLGFAIAKKQLKRAHDRNRIKRLAREFYRLNQHQLPKMDFVLMARTAVMDLDNQQVIALLENLCHRIKRTSLLMEPKS
ncbi:MAG: ribonuclease P protein component [Candidatus Schmidhempelia sp.]|nr:ribonuclease P protein component [Candidatus Schmidhempelia sp.]